LINARLTERLLTALILIWVIVAPVSLGLGSVFSGVILICGVVVLAFSRDARATLPRPILWPLAAFIAWMAVATATAAPWQSKWPVFGNEVWLKLLILCVPALFYRHPRLIDRAIRVWLAAGALVAAYGIYQHFTGDLLFEDGSSGSQGNRFMAVGFFGHHLTYGGHVAILWILAAAWIFSGQAHGRTRAFAICVFVLLSFGLLWSYARSAQLAAFVGVIFLGLFLPHRRKLVLGVMLVLISTAVLATPSLRLRFVEAMNLTTEETRLNLWKSSVAAIEERPLTGFGVGNFGEMLSVHEVEGFYDSRAHSHNDYLMHAVNAGLPAMFFALALIGGTLFVLIRDRDQPRRWIILGAASATVTLAVGGLVQVFQTDDEVEMTLFFLIGCALALIAHHRLRES